MIQKRSGRSGKSVHFNARLPKDVANRLREYADRRRISVSAAAVELLDEALRMERHPGIDFRWTALGRQPFVTGTGLTVWELYHIWLDHDRNVKGLLKHYPHLESARVHAAIDYAKSYLREKPPGLWGSRPSFARVVRV